MSDPRQDSDLSSFEDLVVDLLSSIAASVASIAKTLEKIDQHDEQYRLSLSTKLEKLADKQYPEDEEPAQDDVPLCPDCDSPMVLRKGSRGPFWGCSLYPQCRGSRSEGDRSWA